MPNDALVDKAVIRGIAPDGTVKNVQTDASGNLITTGGGGGAITGSDISDAGNSSNATLGSNGVFTGTGRSTDAGTGLVDVIGGTGGSSPYNRTFSLDLTAAGTFSVTAQIAVTATAV